MSLKFFTIFSMSLLVMVVFSSAGFATDTPIANSLCNVVAWSTGRTGKAIVILAMVITAIMALMNKISWNIAIIHLVGEALVLKAADMVSAISAGGTDC